MLVILKICFFTFATWSQLPDFSYEACDKNLIFTIVEKMPHYKNGNEQLEKDLNEILTFENNVKQDFIFKLFINCEGKVFDVKIINSKHTDTEEKIKSCLYKLQNWEAGSQGKSRVDCYYLFRTKIKKGKLKIVS